MPVSGFSIAVVIPAYNVQDYIQEAIESVLRQERKPDEIIIVNDGSTDNTRQIISKYECDPAVRVIDSENRGLGPARNAGLEAASSEYVYFFDSDDVMAGKFMHVVSKAVEEHGRPDVVVFSGEAFADAKESILFNPPDYKVKINKSFSSGPQMYRELSLSNSLFSSACLYVTRRDVWTESGIRFKPILHEDMDVLMPLFFSFKSGCSVPDVLFFRRVRSGSIMAGKMTEKNAEGMSEVLKSLFLLKKKEPNLVKDNWDLWLPRTRSILVATFDRSIKSGKLIPSFFMVKSLFSVINVRLLLKIFKRYLSVLK